MSKYEIHKVKQEIEVVSDSQEHAEEYVDDLLTMVFDYGCGKKTHRESQWHGSGNPDDYEVTRVFDWCQIEEEDTDGAFENTSSEETDTGDPTRYGYIPHDRQTPFTCSECGGFRFRSYPQGVNVGAPIWTYEFICADCGKRMGLTQFRE